MPVPRDHGQLVGKIVLLLAVYYHLNCMTELYYMCSNNAKKAIFARKMIKGLQKLVKYKI